MQDISASTLMEMTIGLASGVNDQDRFNRLIDAIRKTITCDCVALLSLQGDTLVPIAMQGSVEIHSVAALSFRNTLALMRFAHHVLLFVLMLIAHCLILSMAY